MASVLRQRLPIEVDLTKSAPAPSITSSESDSGIEYDDSDLPPFTPPNYTAKQLFDAIPAHCWNRSALRSSAYVVRDLTFLSTAVYFATFIDGAFGTNGTVVEGVAGVAAKWAAWAVYWVLSSFFGVGIWIIAHECGHQSFSESKSLNNAVGLALHSIVLVPYHSWRISHSKHHAGTGHFERDEVFVPATRSEKLANKPKRDKVVNVGGIDFDELLEDAPIYRLYHILIQQLFGWPAYLINNASGQNFYPKWTNHFDPASLIFDAKHRGQVLISDAGLAVVIAALTIVGHYHGLAAVGKYYVVSYLLVNHWLVLITYLQHTDPNVPHYRAGEWTFPRGALCTIDRNLMGPVGPYLMHGITETHIAHHISSKIPHYHAWEATAALKEFLGDDYTYSDENMFVSLWKNYSSCRFVEDEGQVLFYKNAIGRAARSVVMPTIASDSGVEVEAA